MSEVKLKDMTIAEQIQWWKARAGFEECFGSKMTARRMRSLIHDLERQVA